MSNEDAQNFYDLLVKGLFDVRFDSDAEARASLNDSLLNFISENPDTVYTIKRFDEQIVLSTELYELVRKEDEVEATFLEHLEGTSTLLYTGNYGDLFLQSFNRQMQASIDSGNITVAEIKFILRFKDIIEEANDTFWGDGFQDFKEKLAENPNILPVQELFYSFEQFDFEASKLAKEELANNSTFTVGTPVTLLAAKLETETNATSGVQTEQYILARDAIGAQAAGIVDANVVQTVNTATTIDSSFTGLNPIEKSRFDDIASQKAEVEALKLTSIETNAQQTIGSNSIPNLSTFSEGTKKILIEKWIEYLDEIFIKPTTISDANATIPQQTAMEIIPIIILDYANRNRVATWRLIQDSVGDDEDLENLGEQAEKAAMENAKEASKAADAITLRTLEPDEIAQRQTYRHQCILMARMDILTRYFIAKIGSKDDKVAFHKNKIFDERFYMVHSADSGNFVNNIFASRGEPLNQFLNMTPDIQAFFVPKIKIFKVFNDEDGSLKQVEFPFSAQTHDDNIVKQLFDDSTKPFRGGGYGIKSFSFDFEGGNPTTARRDITAKLSLFFQDFNDFVHEFQSKDTDGQDQTIRFVDMILFDSSRAYPNGINDYKPSYYRIRADVGWHVPGTQFQEFKKVCTARGFSASDLLRCVRETNKTFYLNMVEHTIDFTEQGTANINIEYRAYVESELKSNHLDALADPEILKERIQRAETLNKLYTDSDCKQKDIAEIQNAFQRLSDIDKKNMESSLMNRLIDNQKIYKLSIITDGGFSNAGYFHEVPTIKLDINLGEYTAEDDDAETKQPSVSDTINFFFLGDLLYIMLDTLHDKQCAIDKTSPLGEKIRFVLPSITIEDQSIPGNVIKVNLAQIPISIQYFKEWINKFVLDKDRENYPIMNFLRDLLNHLIADMLIETCYNKQADKSFNFITTSALSHDNKMNGIPKHINPKQKAEQPIIDLEIYDNIFPLVTNRDDDDNIVPIKDIYTYIIIVPNYKNPNPQGVGNYSTDLKKGIPHFEVGLDRGILKTAKFSKTDMQYIREARFFQNGGVDDLLQLAAVYSVDLKLFGNCLFFPGMEIFVNPYSFGGQEFLPNVPGSIASKLGFGGYHLITKVNSEISPGSFNTNVKALYLHSGDGKGRFTGGVVGPKPNDGTPDNTPDIQSPSPQSPQKLDCQDVKQAVFDSATDGTPLAIPSAEGNVEETQATATEETPAEQTITAAQAQQIAPDAPGESFVSAELDDSKKTLLIAQIKATLSGEPPSSGTLVSSNITYLYTKDGSQIYTFYTSVEISKENFEQRPIATATVANGNVEVSLIGESN